MKKNRLAKTGGRPLTTNLLGAESDEQFVKLWLARRNRKTQGAYLGDLRWWKARGVPGAGGWRALRLATVNEAIDQGELGAVSSHARRVASLKSLLSFGHKGGYLMLNLGVMLEIPKVPDNLAERILEPDEVHRLLAAAKTAKRMGDRDHLFVRVLYVAGCRVDELCGLDWSHVHEVPKGGASLTIHGKRGKTRHVWITPGTYAELKLGFGKPGLAPAFDGAVFRSRFGERLSVRSAERLVEAAAARAKLHHRVSPHWLRHGHATHALESGAPIHEVQNDLGHKSVATTSRYLHARPSGGSARYLAGL